jgi:hypothetical protein
MKALFAIAVLVASIAAAPAALAGFTTENSASQNRLGHPQAATGSSFITENSASQNRLGNAPAATGYRFITENSATQNPLNPPATIVAPSGFRWGDAGIGASAMFGAVLLVLGAAIVILRRRERVGLAA